MDGAVDEPRSHYNLALKEFVRQGNWDSAILLLDSMRSRGVNLTPDVDTYSSMLCTEVLHDGCDLSRVLEVLERAGEHVSNGLLENVFEDAVRKVAEAGHAEQAAILLAEHAGRLGAQPNVPLYECALVSCAKKGLSGRVYNLLAIMNDTGLIPTQRMYTIAIKCCGAKVWRALKYLDEMISNEVQPNTITYACAISVCKNAKRWREAKKLIHEMRECSIFPNEVAFANAIHACSRAGEWTEALALLDLMRKEGPSPNVVCYTAALGACAKANQWQSVLDLIDEMRNVDVPPNEITYGLAIRACADAGEWHEVIALYSAMASSCDISEVSDEILVHALTAFSASGDRRSVMELSQELKVRPETRAIAAALSH